MVNVWGCLPLFENRKKRKEGWAGGADYVQVGAKPLALEHHDRSSRGVKEEITAYQSL